MNFSQNQIFFYSVVKVAVLSLFITGCGGGSSPDASDKTLNVGSAEWNQAESRLKIEGEGGDGQIVAVFGADGSILGTVVSTEDGWVINVSEMETIPCNIRVEQENGEKTVFEVKDAPDYCEELPKNDDDEVKSLKIGGAEWDHEKSKLKMEGKGLANTTITFYVGDTDTTIGSIFTVKDEWKVKIINPSPVPCIVRAAYDDGTSASRIIQYAPRDCAEGVVTGPPPPPPAGESVSINSTSRSSAATMPDLVTEVEWINDPMYRLFAVNDLGMHCGDLDTRISSILPPFNVIHAQVIERGMNGNNPRILNEGEAHLFYSAASNPNDPIAAIDPVLARDGSLYKTNFWDSARQAYTPFYPSGILGLFYPDDADIVDVGLPVPDVERFYLEEPGFLHASQQAMPGINDPLATQEEQEFHEHIGTMPFFAGFDFGYTADVNWYEAPGIPVAVYDDRGRPNPYPLMRIRAEVDGEHVASVDTVVPISGEAECQRCHSDTADGGNGSAIAALQEEVAKGNARYQIVISTDDPAADVPGDANIEWASDQNLLKLHDLKHGTTLWQEPDPETGAAPNPVVCQVCHYTPALDLAQFGPLGEENDSTVTVNTALGPYEITSLANGRDQVKHKTMSNVMHSHHASVTGTDGSHLFPDMPPAVDAEGNKRDAQVTADILGQTCYACHPGTDTQCMRGAMANGGLVCQDCHGNMEQVGNDFSRNVSPSNPGAFEVGHDFYTNAQTPRVPWANEPGCGSCHTGDALDNMATLDNTLTNPLDEKGNADGIRLAQAFLTDDVNAKPIIPKNSRFAENRVNEGKPADGNPKLYRVSTGHGGLFCEACHGPTHAEWPNSNPYANDNVMANQVQGHSGTIVECNSCHEGDLGNTLDGPHGMHPVGDTLFARGGHEEMLEHGASGDDCRACHGQNGEGTVLARAAVDRRLHKEEGMVQVRQGDMISCRLCHENEL